MKDLRPDIWRLQAKFDTQGLVDALTNEDAGIRKRAAAALRALGAVESIPDLKRALDNEQDPDTRANLVAALAALEADTQPAEDDPPSEDDEPDSDGVERVEQLVAKLGDDDETVVLDAVNKLADLGNKQAVDSLVVLFNETGAPSQIRLAAAEALLKLESAPVEVALLGALHSDKWRVRRNGAAILGQLRAAWAVQPLATALKDKSEVVQRTARAALQHINTDEALAALGQTRPIKPKASDNKKATRPIQKDPPPNKQPDADKQPSSDAQTESKSKPGPQDAQTLPAVRPDSPTRPARPTQKLSWPKRETPSDNLVPTKPLDPNRLNEHRDRLEKSDSDSSEDE